MPEDASSDHAESQGLPARLDGALGAVHGTLAALISLEERAGEERRSAVDIDQWVAHA